MGLPGCCCGGNNKEDEECETTQFKKGGDKDMSGGPCPPDKRRCTDVLCCCIYGMFWIGLVVVTFAGAQHGDPRRLYRPRDFMGGYCGIDGGLESAKKQMMMMNVTATVDSIAKQLVCSSVADSSLQVALSTSDYADYLCACCLTPCRSCSGSFDYTDFSSASDLATQISGKMKELTNFEMGADLFSSSSLNLDSFSAEDIWGQLTQYFVAVCKTGTCALDLVNSSTTFRRYVYSPDPEHTWKTAWDTLATNPSVAQEIKDTIHDQFNFSALPHGECPYDAKYCVPFPGVEFSEKVNDWCVPKPAASVAEAISTAAAATLEGLGNTAIGEAATGTIGSAVGDFFDTLDAFFITCFWAFVVGLVFMVLLRFFVGMVVWLSIGLVLVLLLFGGGLLYVRSHQCADAGLFDSGTNAVTSVAITAQYAVSGGDLGSEDLTGNGADYVGYQTYTRSGRTCQRWDATSPHDHIYAQNLSAYPKLTENYCRNPADAQTIWCYTTDTEVSWELCDPIGVVNSECIDGYAVETEEARKALEICAYIVWALAVVWVLLVFCLYSRINLAIAINKVAAMFMYHTPTALLVPLVQVFAGILWCVLWATSASFLLSQVPDDYVPDGYYTYQEAEGTADTPGECTDKWPTGFSWKDDGDASQANNPCSGDYGILATNETARCWRCGPPRYAIDARVAYSFFCFLWNNALLIAIGQCVIAGAVAAWFFTPTSAKGKQSDRVRESVWICFRYHLGSLAFGAFIIALVQFIRYCMKYLEKQAAAQKNRVMVYVLKALQCCIWCFEKCLKFLNKNAYIQIAIMGTNFCTSAKNAFFLIMRNVLRFGTVAVLGSIIHFIGFVFIMVVATAIGYFVLMAMHPDAEPVVPVLSYVAVGYVVAKLYMSVFGLAVDTSLQCFIAAEEMGDSECCPAPLKKLVNKPHAQSAWAWFSGDKNRGGDDTGNKSSRVAPDCG